MDVTRRTRPPNPNAPTPMELRQRDLRPPCWEADQPCPNPCADAHYQRVVYNHLGLYGPWGGWRLAGRDLVAPDGIRISPERLRGLLWRADATDLRDQLRRGNAQRKAVRQQSVKVVVVELADWQARHFGSRAG